MSGMADEPIEPSLHGLLESLLYSDRLVIVFFWFLTMLFVLFNLMYGAVRIFKGRLRSAFYLVTGSVAILLNLLIDPYGICLFSLGRVAQLMVYFVVGMAYATWEGTTACLSEGRCFARLPALEWLWRWLISLNGMACAFSTIWRGSLI